MSQQAAVQSVLAKINKPRRPHGAFTFKPSEVKQVTVMSAKIPPDARFIPGFEEK